MLGVSIAKEGVEDYRRYKADKDMNNRVVLVLEPTTGAWVSKKWKDLQVGEIVQVQRDEYFPADLLFLSAENNEGICYIETMNCKSNWNMGPGIAMHHECQNAVGLCM